MIFFNGASKNPILFSIYFYFGLNELPSVGSALRSFCKILIYYDRDNSWIVSTAVFQKLQALNIYIINSNKKQFKRY